jgi:hypothetical protein
MGQNGFVATQGNLDTRMHAHVTLGENKHAQKFLTVSVALEPDITLVTNGG